MLNLVLFGGGRWARVIAGVLGEILPEKHHIFWVSRYGQDELAEWKKKKSANHITLLTEDASVWDNKIHASIVATAPVTHALYAEKSMARGIPTLIEKPFAINMAEANRLMVLAKETVCPVGVNHVFMYASYLEDFAARLKDVPIKNIKITWHDPALETRYGEEKRPDFYTSMAHDMFPHTWSILRILCPDPDIMVNDVTYAPDGTVLIRGNAASISLEISLSRRSAGRMRQININGDQWILDFTQEPGFILHQNSKIENQWRGATPLSRSLREFLNIAKDPSCGSGWRVSADNCIKFVGLSDEVKTLLETAQYERLRNLQEKGEDLPSNHAHLLIDLFLPKAALEGKRPSVKTPEEQKNFAAQALSLYDKKGLT
jgi:predicted dehydrogenase